MRERLFTPLAVGPLVLKNRITMTPMYLGYAGPGGCVSGLLLDHYRLMAGSGAALVVVESSAVDFERGGGSQRMLRIDRDRDVEGISKLAAAIKSEGALAGIQLNHTGRFADAPLPLAPTDIDTVGLNRKFKEMDGADIEDVTARFASAAARARAAGFDLVELHGASGYLLAQFASPWTNRRADGYGGSPENRRRFPLELLRAVRRAAGPGFPVGYRFMADEWMPEGLGLSESAGLARALEEEGAAYLSVSGGTWESFILPEILARSLEPGFMVPLAAAVKKAVNIAP